MPRHVLLIAALTTSFLLACDDSNDDSALTPNQTEETRSVQVADEGVLGEEASAPGLALPERGVATEATRAANERVANELPLDDQNDFEDARRGLIAQIEDDAIRSADGKVVWELRAYDFLESPAPATANPSLWRQAQLNAIHGLFEVVDGIYQLRGYDLSVMTLIRSDTGWIVVDPLLSKETAKAAFELAQKHLGERPVKAVLFTHSHADHFGGIRGIVEEEDVVSGKIKIVAPIGFTHHAVSEELLSGNPSFRRSVYMFGTELPTNAIGLIDSGIGKTISAGTEGLMEPTDIVTETGQTMTIDGVDIVFQNASGSEAPAEFIFYLPQFKALSSAEVVTHTLHNVLTLRGALVRDALLWSKYIDEAAKLFGNEVEVVFGSHNWPTWGNENVLEYLYNQRDIYKYIHDQTLRLANHGLTPTEIAEAVGEPSFLKHDFSARGYYGTINHNVKATYQRYFGWFDGNPANLNPLPPEEAGRKYVELAGGANAVLEKARAAFDQGEYRWVAMLLNHLVFAESDNETARLLLASAHEQMGFQAESSAWRNIYLSGAYELREGVKGDEFVTAANPDFVAAVPLELLFDALAVRVNPEKVGSNTYTVNFNLSDTGEKIGVRINNGVANHRYGENFENADISVQLTRKDLDDIILGLATFEDKLEAGVIQAVGNVNAFSQYLSVHDEFNFWFNIVTP